MFFKLPDLNSHLYEQDLPFETIFELSSHLLSSFYELGFVSNVHSTDQIDCILSQTKIFLITLKSLKKRYNEIPSLSSQFNQCSPDQAFSILIQSSYIDCIKFESYFTKNIIDSFSLIDPEQYEVYLDIMNEINSFEFNDFKQFNNIKPFWIGEFKNVYVNQKDFNSQELHPLILLCQSKSKEAFTPSDCMKAYTVSDCMKAFIPSDYMEVSTPLACMKLLADSKNLHEGYHFLLTAFNFYDIFLNTHNLNCNYNYTNGFK